MPIRYGWITPLLGTGLLMSKLPPTIVDRRREAESLIEIARGLLDRPEEEMVVNYLDHAIEALNMIEPDSPSA
ncbi:MAG: hypothetical protein J0J06_12995 [Sphingomonas sp.]|uniref:hypothetical protein n=1 Tax=Sphingomonas sp. TaxID=28214 RepID=UPI001AC7674B|nr:hypothetical protein [Sphingomonas sp.]MBN8816350.1 hypothetical protein [Sphingomonas sp.]